MCATGGNFIREYWHRPEADRATRSAAVGITPATSATSTPTATSTSSTASTDMIVTGGENVYSIEVENAISTHPAVAQVAVIGIPHPVWGEQVHAIVVLRPGSTATDPRHQGHTRVQSIAAYKVPKTIDFRTEPLPVSGALKPLKTRAPCALLGWTRTVKGSVALTDGTTVDLREMQAQDDADLVRFHHTLSTETTYLRFFSVHPELSVAELDRFTHVDHRDREAIVARIDGAIVGVARFDRINDSDRAEVAFVVSDLWQGHGLGTTMFAALAARAREVGISWFVADTLPHNTKMLRVFHDAGLPVSSEFRDGVVHLVIGLGVAGT